MEKLLKKFELSPGAHLGAHTDGRYASAGDSGDLSPGAHLGAHTDRRHACAADFGDNSPGAPLGAHTDHRARSLSRGNCKSDQAPSIALLAERISQRAAEQIVDASVPQIQEQIVEVATTTPQERFSERTVLQTEDVPVPQILNEIVEMVKAVKTVTRDRVPETICEQIVDAPFPQAVHEPVPSFQEEIVEMINLSGRARSEAHNPGFHAPGAHLRAYTRTDRRSTG